MRVIKKRISKLTDQKKRDLVWFLHWRSHQPGGLRQLAYEILLRNFRTRLGSATMHRLGFGPETVFKGPDFEQICCEIDFYPLGTVKSVLRELEDAEAMLGLLWEHHWSWGKRQEHALKEEQNRQ